MKNQRQWLQSGVAALLLGMGTSAFGQIVIDNGDAATSFTGRWYESSAPGAHGASSLYSGNLRQYIWTFDCPDSGEYIVSMWWTEWPSRSTGAKVLIASDAGTTKLYLNQRKDGGKWNSIGKYPYTAGKAYTVTIVSAPGSVTTCADAVKFEKFNPPAADFSADRYRGPAPFTMHFSNRTEGEVDGWHWDFGDGQTSSEKNPSHTYTTPGAHSVSLTATGSQGAHTKTWYSCVDVKADATENIYICDGYGGNDYLPSDIHDKMWDMGATETANGWMYRPANSNMTYYITMLRDGQSLLDALYEENAHVIIGGHANYGFGLVFATAREIVEHRIDDYECIDDDRLLNCSTDCVAARIDGMKYGQAYPNWEPVFKDGGSGIMPYDFGDPRGNPPYNYCLTYQLPGDPTHYRMEMDGKYVERFGDSGVPAWYSPDGLEPDPTYDRACFITNSSGYYNRFDCVGEWVVREHAGANHTGEESVKNYNYQVQWPGSGTKVARWRMLLKRPGQYRVMATWPALAENAVHARYTVYHSGGSSAAYADQSKSSDRNSLGVYNFNAGLATIELDDNADGYLAADAMILRPVADAEKILCAEFDADVRSRAAPLTVNFTNTSHHYTYDDSAQVAGCAWDFGDGTVSSDEHPSHTYNQKGAYTVTLRVTATDGREDIETKKYFIVAGVKVRPQAQFRALTMQGMQTTEVAFHDQSSGDINRWSWDFGDGQTSQQRNPVHTYTKPGRYSVRLTVYGPGGQGAETEKNYIHNFLGECYTDNSFQVRPHYNSGATTVGKVVCYAGPSSVDRSQLRYARLFHGSCNSLPYYGGVFNHGLMYGKMNDVVLEHDTAVDYLEYYLLGYADKDILDHINGLDDIHGFYNFSEKPPSMIHADAAAANPTGLEG
jgi:PKD repeat protein